jgi:hypothetical protein
VDKASPFENYGLLWNHKMSLRPATHTVESVSGNRSKSRKRCYRVAIKLQNALMAIVGRSATIMSIKHAKAVKEI